MAAPNLKEIEWAIEELKNAESSKGNYIFMAALLRCRDEMLGVSAEPQVQSPTASPPETQYRYSGMGRDAVGDYGDSEFLQAVRGKDAAEMWGIMDTAMKTMQVISRKTYDGIMDMILQ